MSIHPTAIIDAQAQIDPSAEIGPHCVVDGHVRISARCQLYANVFVTGWTQLGERCILHPNSVVGHEPQDVKYAGERTYCRVGSDTVIRENVTIHRGTTPESETVVGGHCYLMAGSHVAHNCRLGDHVTLANNVLLAGHVSVGDRSTLGGGCVVHQFCRIGDVVMIRGTATVISDVLHYAMVATSGKIAGLNAVGLRRLELPRDEILELREVFRHLFSKRGRFSDGVEHLRRQARSAAARRVLAFLESESKRGFAGGTRQDPPENDRKTC